MQPGHQPRDVVARAVAQDDDARRRPVDALDGVRGAPQEGQEPGILDPLEQDRVVHARPGHALVLAREGQPVAAAARGQPGQRQPEDGMAEAAPPDVPEQARDAYQLPPTRP
jgi:hypothetical protein